MREYEQWSTRHALTFDFQWDKDKEMFRQWEAVFDNCGYCIDELREATLFLSSHPDLMPKSRADNLAAIHHRIRQRRLALLRHNEENGPTSGEAACELCLGSGWVQVPHLRSVVDGLWVHPWYSLAVVCNCHRGDHVLSTWTGPSKRDDIPRPLGIGAYQAKNPLWFQQMARRKQEQLVRVEARESALAADGFDFRTSFDQAIDAIRQRTKGRREC